MSVIATAGAAFFSGAGTDSAAIDPAASGRAIRSLKGALCSEDNEPPLLRNFINGQWVTAKANGGNKVEVRDPATGNITCFVADSDKDDVQAAVLAAHKAKDAWAATSNHERAALLQRVSVMLKARLEDLALMESADAGKPVRLARIIDIPRSSENFDFFARMLLTDSQSAHSMADAVNITQVSTLFMQALMTCYA